MPKRKGVAAHDDVARSGRPEGQSGVAHGKVRRTARRCGSRPGNWRAVVGQRGAIGILREVPLNPHLTDGFIPADGSTSLRKDLQAGQYGKEKKNTEETQTTKTFHGALLSQMSTVARFLYVEWDARTG